MVTVFEKTAGPKELVISTICWDSEGTPTDQCALSHFPPSVLVHTLVVSAACAGGTATTAKVRKAIHETQVNNLVFIRAPFLVFSLWRRRIVVIAPGRKVM